MKYTYLTMVLLASNGLYADKAESTKKVEDVLKELKSIYAEDKAESKAVGSIKYGKIECKTTNKCLVNDIVLRDARESIEKVGFKEVTKKNDLKLTVGQLKMTGVELYNSFEAEEEKKITFKDFGFTLNDIIFEDIINKEENKLDVVSLLFNATINKTKESVIFDGSVQYSATQKNNEIVVTIDAKADMEEPKNTIVRSIVLDVKAPFEELAFETYRQNQINKGGVVKSKDVFMSEIKMMPIEQMSSQFGSFITEDSISSLKAYMNGKTNKITVQIDNPKMVTVTFYVEMFGLKMAEMFTGEPSPYKIEDYISIKIK